MIFLLFITLLKYNVTDVEETGESYPPSCRSFTPAGWFFMTVPSVPWSFLCGGKDTSKAGTGWEEGASIMTVEERVPNERLRHARSLKGWSQAKLAEEVGTSFEMVSRWERGITIPTPYFRAQLCVALGMTAEELGLVHGSSDLLALPTSHFVFLASSYADSEKATVTRLKTVLQKQGITLWSSRHIGRRGLEQPRKAL